MVLNYFNYPLRGQRKTSKLPNSKRILKHKTKQMFLGSDNDEISTVMHVKTPQQRYKMLGVILLCFRYNKLL